MSLLITITASFWPQLRLYIWQNHDQIIIVLPRIVYNEGAICEIQSKRRMNSYGPYN